MKKLSLILVLFVLFASWSFVRLGQYEDLEDQFRRQEGELRRLKLEVVNCGARENALLDSSISLKRENFYLNSRLRERQAQLAPAKPKRITTNKPTPKNESKSPVSVAHSERFNSILAKRYADRP